MLWRGNHTSTRHDFSRVEHDGVMNNQRRTIMKSDCAAAIFCILRAKQVRDRGID
jgi:hypothetical protein